MHRRIHWRQGLLAIGDFLLLNIALLVVLVLRRPAMISGPYVAEFLIAYAWLFLLWQLSNYALGLYDLRRLRDTTWLIHNLLLAAAIGWALGVMYFYLLSPHIGLTPKTILFLTIIIGHSGLFALRRFWVSMLSSRKFRQKVVFLTDPRHGRMLGLALKQRDELGFYSVKWTGKPVDLVVADNAWIKQNWKKATFVLDTALRERIPVVTMETFYESAFGQLLPEHTADPDWAIEYVLERIGHNYIWTKRLLDLVISALLLIGFTPLISLLWLVVRVVDGAPVFYAQTRIGFLGKPFKLWKIRTMVVAADSAGPFLPDEESHKRVTLLGRILRRFRLDELPQVWNVLKGEMSFVGPRPELIREVTILEKVVPQYHLRHLVRPGITGWAQVNFRATNNPRDSVEKLRFDLFYLKNSSLALDLGIMLKTVKRVFVKDTAAGMSLPQLRRPGLLSMQNGPDISALLRRK